MRSRNSKSRQILKQYLQELGADSSLILKNGPATPSANDVVLDLSALTSAPPRSSILDPTAAMASHLAAAAHIRSPLPKDLFQTPSYSSSSDPLGSTPALPTVPPPPYSRGHSPLARGLSPRQDQSGGQSNALESLVEDLEPLDGNSGPPSTAFPLSPMPSSLARQANTAKPSKRTAMAAMAATISEAKPEELSSAPDSKLQADMEARLNLAPGKLDKMMSRFSKPGKKAGPLKAGDFSSSSSSAPDLPPSTSSSAIPAPVSVPEVSAPVSKPTSSISGPDLGDLASISVGNTEPPPLVGGDKTGTADMIGVRTGKSGTWKPRWTLRSHFDSVRALAWHPTDSILVSGSEDGTVKCWFLSRFPAPIKQKGKSVEQDYEPSHTYRGHAGAVLSVIFSRDGSVFFSGDATGALRGWRLPGPSETDLYPAGGQVITMRAAVPSLAVLEGHKDAVWSLAVHPVLDRLLSASADSSIRCWDISAVIPSGSSGRQLFEFSFPVGATKDKAHVPTSVTWVPTDLKCFAASFATGALVMVNSETQTVLWQVDAALPESIRPDPSNPMPIPPTPQTGKQINVVLAHHTLPLLITAHEDKYLRFWDSSSGERQHSMIGHLDAVSALALDQQGSSLMSGSHDCSLRFWALPERSCVQELTGHRKKWDEAIFAVAVHPSRSLAASGGGDSTVKIFAY